MVYDTYMLNQNDMFDALADPIRRNILEVLSKKGELSASDIYKRFDVSAPAISQHLKVLHTSKLVHVRKNAQRRMYSLNHGGLIELEEWMQRLAKHWDRRFDALEKVIEKERNRK
jgi:DNA-binding transcriptional ArsR family regulator